MAGRRTLRLVVVVAVLTAGCTSPGGSGQPAGGPGAAPPSPTEAATAAGDDGAVEGSGEAPGGDEGTGDPEATDPGDDGAATATRPAAEVPLPEVDVLLNCTMLRVTVTPEAWHYRLYLRYLDTVTGEQRRIAAGFFTGEVTDHFGTTDFDLVAVEVRVTGFSPVLRTRPTRCAE